MVPVAHGNDGGGSVRIPAACCGLVGLKPSRGRISAAPELGDSSLGIDGMLTRTVADTAAILDVLAGYEPGRRDLGAAPGRVLRGRRRARSRPPADSRDHDLAPGAGAGRPGVRAPRSAMPPTLLRSLGHEVSEVEPPWRQDGIGELFGAVFASQISLSIAYSARVAGRMPEAGDMEPMSWAIFSMVSKMGAIEVLAANVQLQAFARRLVAFLAPYDALLTPSLAERPLPIGTLDTAAPDPMATFTRSGLFTPFTPIVNATGQPAISLPLYQGQDGLPLGVQLVGRPAGEEGLLSLAAQIERALPWAGRRADLAAAA